jgi:hypothetical protein
VEVEDVVWDAAAGGRHGGERGGAQDGVEGDDAVAEEEGLSPGGGEAPGMVGASGDAVGGSGVRVGVGVGGHKVIGRWVAVRGGAWGRSHAVDDVGGPSVVGGGGVGAEVAQSLQSWGARGTAGPADVAEDLLELAGVEVDAVDNTEQPDVEAVLGEKLVDQVRRHRPEAVEYEDVNGVERNETRELGEDSTEGTGVDVVFREVLVDASGSP